MLIDFLVEWVAEGDGVFPGIGLRRGLISVVKPKSKAVEKVKTRPVGDAAPGGLIVGAKEDGRSEDSLEALYDASVMTTVFREVEEVQHLGGAGETHCAALLSHGECRYPDGNEPILTKGQTESGMPGNLKEELAVAPSVGELIFGWWAKRKAAEHEGTSVVGEVLLATLPFLADEGYGLELP